MSEQNEDRLTHEELLEFTTEIASAYLGNNSADAGQIPDVLQSIFGTLKSLDAGGGQPQREQKPAVPIKRSVQPDYIVCLEDGKELKMLKRHLRTNYDMTPEEYRAKWNLPPDYPMVAPNYAKQRSEFARQIGLGRKNAGKGKKKG